MKIAIIGHEEKKFTPATKREAISAISHIVLAAAEPPVIVSGRCHLGGVDIWAEEVADSLKVPKIIFPPEVHWWDGGDRIGYKQRNIQIAQAADVVYVIVVASLPPGYPPEKWNRGPCYHCAKRSSTAPRHVKSGACWTAWHAVEQLKKQAHWIVI